MSQKKTGRPLIYGKREALKVFLDPVIVNDFRELCFRHNVSISTVMAELIELILTSEALQNRPISRYATEVSTFQQDQRVTLFYSTAMDAEGYPYVRTLESRLFNLQTRDKALLPFYNKRNIKRQVASESQCT